MDWRIADVAFYRPRAQNSARSAAFVSDRGAVEWNSGKLRFIGKKRTIEMIDVSVVEPTQQWTLWRPTGVLWGAVVGLIIVFLTPIGDPLMLWSFGPPRPALWKIIGGGFVFLSFVVYAVWSQPDFKDAVRLRNQMIHIVFRDAAGQPCEAYFEDLSPAGRLLERLRAELFRSPNTAA